jgi:hypothetical protein
VNEGDETTEQMDSVRTEPTDTQGEYAPETDDDTEPIPQPRPGTGEVTEPAEDTGQHTEPAVEDGEMLTAEMDAEPQPMVEREPGPAPAGGTAEQAEGARPDEDSEWAPEPFASPAPLDFGDTQPSQETQGNVVRPSEGAAGRQADAAERDPEPPDAPPGDDHGEYAPQLPEESAPDDRPRTRIYPIESAQAPPELTPAEFNKFAGGVDQVTNSGEPLYRVVGMSDTERHAITARTDADIATELAAGKPQTMTRDERIAAAIDQRYEDQARNGQWFTTAPAQSADDALQRAAVASEWASRVGTDRVNSMHVTYRQYKVTQAEGPVDTFEGRAKPQGSTRVDAREREPDAYRDQLDRENAGRGDHYTIHAELEGYGTQVFVPNTADNHERDRDLWRVQEEPWDYDRDDSR